MTVLHHHVTSRFAVGRIASKNAFTLIEMSIVLVIIGLIIGGVLVGRDLIAASIVRSQISQIEKYNSAVNTFRGKYGYLPGDIPDPTAQGFGLQARGSYSGEGDGNGQIEGVWSNAAGANTGIAIMGGETAMFWKDLSSSGFIAGAFTSASPDSNPGAISGAGIDRFFPQAALGGGNYIYVYNWYGPNFFGLSAVTGSFGGNQFYDSSGTSVIVQQAYNIDMKTDDGLPQTGNVTAIYLAGNLSTGSRIWAAGGGAQGASNTNATAGSTTTCYDNSSTANGTPGVAGVTQHYSTEMNNGTGNNCALSFRFQ